MEPQDPYLGWAAGSGHLRASDADRERVIDALKAAFVQGRLTKGELARRVGQALESRTYADLAGVTAAIPAAPAARLSPRQPASPVPASPMPVSPVAARLVNWKVIAWVVGVIIVMPALGVAFFATYYGSFYILLLLGFVASGLIGSPGAGRRSVF
jgi:hypothetical protein